MRNYLKTIPELGKEMQTGLSVTTLNTVLFVMLKKEIKDLTLEQVSDLVDEYADNMPYITEKVCEAINAAYEVNSPKRVTAEEEPEWLHFSAEFEFGITI